MFQQLGFIIITIKSKEQQKSWRLPRAGALGLFSNVLKAALHWPCFLFNCSPVERLTFKSGVTTIVNVQYRSTLIMQTIDYLELNADFCIGADVEGSFERVLSVIACLMENRQCVCAFFKSCRLIKSWNGLCCEYYVTRLISWTLVSFLFCFIRYVLDNSYVHVPNYKLRLLHMTRYHKLK